MPEQSRTVIVGHLSKEARFELIITGPFGPKEIGYLIRKLKLDEEILRECEQEDDQ